LTFDVVFGVFAASMLVIACLVIKWAAGNMRAARREMIERAKEDSDRADGRS
jgi:hypothetical protein